MSNFSDVGEFHEKFELPVVDGSHIRRAVPDDLIVFRQEFMQEELDEFIEACEVEDEAKMFDALLDLVYVAMGTAHLLNYPWQSGWDEVQRANLAKVRAAADGSNSKRVSAWDVVKPEGWTPPDIDAVLRGER